MTYDKNKDSNHFELYVNNRREDAITLTTAGSLFGAAADGEVYIGGTASGNANPSHTDYFTGFMEEITMYNKAWYVVPNNNEYVLDTFSLVDQISGRSNTHQAKLFVFDYHNIRGVSDREVAETNTAAWEVTAV